jgi:hypothetical protein
MEGFLGLVIVMLIVVVIRVIAIVVDKQEEERLRKEAEEKEELRQRGLAFSLSLIYIFNNRDLSASFNRDEFQHYTAMFNKISFAGTSELQNEGFIKATTPPRFNYDNNGIYKSTTPAQYQITETGIAFLKENYKGSWFEYQLNKQRAPQSVEELRIEAAKKEAIEKQEMQKRIKQLEAKIEDAEQEQQDLQNRQTMLTWWAINNHYNHHK